MSNKARRWCPVVGLLAVIAVGACGVDSDAGRSDDASQRVVVHFTKSAPTSAEGARFDDMPHDGGVVKTEQAVLLDSPSGSARVAVRYGCPVGIGDGSGDNDA
ncbi:MAG: hypothetical protein QOK43_2298 [Acidimicrobiaceae bacterium]|nr:hypothetical protein [Acidimicrobiaceae bacterium]